jgi:biopolymer transport protein ExbD
VRFPHNAKVFRGQLDVAPFAGVFFLLVLMVLLQSSLVFTPGVPIQLPEASGLPGIEGPTVAVAVDQAGQLYFENQVIDEATLKTRLKAVADKAGEPVTLVVQADEAVRHRDLTRLWLVAQEAGLKAALQATRPPLVPTSRPPAP